MHNVFMTKDEPDHIILEGEKMRRQKECSDQVCAQENLVPVISFQGTGLQGYKGQLLVQFQVCVL